MGIELEFESPERLKINTEEYIKNHRYFTVIKISNMSKAVSVIEG